MRRFRDIKFDRGAERMKPKVIVRQSAPRVTSSQPLMQDSLLAQVKCLLASKENSEITPAPNAYTLPSFTDNLQMKIRCRLQNRPKHIKDKIDNQGIKDIRIPVRASSTLTQKPKPRRQQSSPTSKFVTERKARDEKRKESIYI